VAVFPKETAGEEGDEETPIKPQPEVAPAEDNILQKGIEVLTKGVSQVARDSMDSPGQGRPLTPSGVPTTPRN
jgi:hypothetical protein